MQDVSTPVFYAVKKSIWIIAEMLVKPVKLRSNAW
jgi:hypothetical protein